MKILIINMLLKGILAFGAFSLLVACTESEEPAPTNSSPTLTDQNLPPELLTEIFTEDIPEKIKNVDNFLKKIEGKGMRIQRDSISVRPHTSLPRFIFRNVCVYDETNQNNIGFEFGSYVELISISYNQFINRYEVTNGFFSKGNDLFPSYPEGTDKGSGKGIIVGNGNNEFTIFLRAEGNFQEVSYKAIWIVSYTVEYINQKPTVPRNVTKCLVMVSKGPDPDGKVASVGAIRIFKDDAPTPGTGD